MTGSPTWSPRRRRVLGDALLVTVVVGIDLLVWSGDRELWNGALLPVWVVPVTSAAAGALLLARWRNPVAVWSVQWTYALANLALPGYYPFAPLLVALHAVAVRCHRASRGWPCSPPPSRSGCSASGRARTPRATAGARCCRPRPCG